MAGPILQENERHSVVYKKNGKEILVKQIAGALANSLQITYNPEPLK